MYWVMWLDFALYPDQKSIEYSQFDTILPEYIFDYAEIGRENTSQLLLF